MRHTLIVGSILLMLYADAEAPTNWAVQTLTEGGAAGTFDVIDGREAMMEYKLLSTLRYFIPGMMLYFLLVSICWATKWCELEIPKTWEEFLKLSLAAVLAYPYTASKLRNRMNEFYFEAVNKNLVKGLTEPFKGDPGVPRGLTWQQIRSTFYHLVNSDAALTHHSRRAYANGALWTSAADLRAISLIGVLAFITCILVGQLFEIAEFPPIRAIAGIAVCLLLMGISFRLSSALTQKHIEIGNEQLEHILTHHKDKLRDLLSEIRV
jgi:hypothetical protein